ncbi:hypothetical protein BJ875DRAFT_224045 [Amylocarpus encephaloides]|uniref:RING-type domain-containing protein n=1 Tax=Amylocarpus encephaloides TaxID=45428 RepID=A0A9P7Y813_9HELO|nr:hypothetical protein BJ875DRAFT_224045 [Amylocarpus encephaloides]
MAMEKSCISFTPCILCSRIHGQINIMDRTKLRKSLSFTTLPFRHDPGLACIDNHFEPTCSRQQRPKLPRLPSFRKTSSEKSANLRAPIGRKTTFCSVLEKRSTIELESELGRRMEAGNAQVESAANVKSPRQSLGTMVLQQVKHQGNSSMVEVQEEPKHVEESFCVASTNRLPAPKQRSTVFGSIRKMPLPLSTQVAPNLPSTIVLTPLEVKRTRKAHQSIPSETHDPKVQVQVQNKNPNRNICPVCLEDLKQTIRIVPCSHDLCDECFVAWQGQRSASGKHSACPQCREFVMGIRVFSQ